MTEKKFTTISTIQFVVFTQSSTYLCDTIQTLIIKQTYL